MDNFWSGFTASFESLFLLGIIVVVAGVLARKGVFSEEMISGITKGVVYCFLPCLIFDKITFGFNPGSLDYWWVIPLSALVMFLVGLTISTIANRKNFRKEPNLLPLGFMQNAGYFSIAVGETLVPEFFDTWAVYTFLYILVFNPLLWSFGKYLISHDGVSKFQWKGIITPPLMANFIGMTIASLGLSGWIPSPVKDATHLLGSAAVPLSLIILGSTLATTRFRPVYYLKPIVRSFIIKLIIIPAIMMVVLVAIDLPPELSLLGLFLVLQSAYPQASNLVLQVRTYGGNWEQVCAVLIPCYLGSLITIPIWVGIWFLVRN